MEWWGVEGAEVGNGKEGERGGGAVVSPRGSEIRGAHQLSWKVVEGHAPHHPFEKKIKSGASDKYIEKPVVYRTYWWGREENSHPEWPDHTYIP